VRRDDAVFVISVAARLAGMHANTLRKYERERLLSPARTDGNLRLYSNEDMARLQQIKTLSEEHGINVAGIRLALSAAEELLRLRRDVSDDPAFGDALPDRQRTLVARIDRVLEQLGFLANS
jgi:MerR family transcriptional regulator/heat shock protein HspR